MADRRRVAWILGAGFSVPLGGPLLARLLSRASFISCDSRFREQLAPHRWAALYACAVFHFGRNFEQGYLREFSHARPPGDILWSDAEEFLDQLDVAARDNGVRAHIERAIEEVSAHISKPAAGMPTIADMLDAARRLVAHECNQFVVDGNPALEKWSAHYSWWLKVKPGHSIVTFNYDRVVETLEAHRMSHLHTGSSPLLAVTPTTDEDMVTHESIIPLFKLHGSVDWRRTPPATPNARATYTALADQARDAHHLFTAPKNTIAIAMPGPAKKETTSDLKPVWESAESAIENAEAIVFVGYSFPKSDSYALARLLGAVERAAKNARGILRIHIILGQNREAESRLHALIKSVCVRAGAVQVERPHDPGRALLPNAEAKRFAIEVHPMYSQDFFAVYDEKLLFL